MKENDGYSFQLKDLLRDNDPGQTDRLRHAWEENCMAVRVLLVQGKEGRCRCCKVKIEPEWSSLSSASIHSSTRTSHNSHTNWFDRVPVLLLIVGLDQSNGFSPFVLFLMRGKLINHRTHKLKAHTPSHAGMNGHLWIATGQLARTFWWWWWWWWWIWWS